MCHPGASWIPTMGHAVGRSNVISTILEAVVANSSPMADAEGTLIISEVHKRAEARVAKTTMAEALLVS